MFQLGSIAKTTLGSFSGSEDTLRMMREFATGSEGEQHFAVRRCAEGIVRQIAPKDYLSEIVAIRHWASGPWIRYTNDASHVELVKTPFRAISEIAQNGKTLLDCDDIATLIAALGLSLGRSAQFCAVSFSPFGQYTHVFVRLLEPKSKAWIVCDPVAGTREAQMLSRVKRARTIDVHPELA